MAIYWQATFTGTKNGEPQRVNYLDISDRAKAEEAANAHAAKWGLALQGLQPVEGPDIRRGYTDANPYAEWYRTSGPAAALPVGVIESGLSG